MTDPILDAIIAEFDRQVNEEPDSRTGYFAREDDGSLGRYVIDGHFDLTKVAAAARWATGRSADSTGRGPESSSALE
jgi:hypothetical protein